MPELLKDEKKVVWWLQQYGPLPYRQIERLLHSRTKVAVEKIIRNVKRMGYAVDVENGYYLALSPQDKPDQRRILALWVLLEFIGAVDPMSHAPTEFPSSVFFLKENTGYEIIVLHGGEQHHLRMLQVQPETKYIIVVPTIEMAQNLVLPSAPHLFATVDWFGKADPQVLFYQEGELTHGV